MIVNFVLGVKAGKEQEDMLCENSRNLNFLYKVQVEITV